MTFPLSSVFDLGGKIVERIFPDPKQAAEAKAKLAEMQLNGELQKMALEAGLMQGQIEVNKIEAASTNMFVAGWRPFIGWVCGAALAYSAIVDPLVNGRTPDTTITMQVLLGLLGLGGLRTWEKIKGAEGNR